MITLWTDGWHHSDTFDYYVENGYFVRGVTRESSISQKPVYPYTFNAKNRLYTNRSRELKANKYNFERIFWL